MNKKILLLFCLCFLTGCVVGELDLGENRAHETENCGTKE